MKKLTTSVLAIVLTSSFAVMNAQNTADGDTLRTTEIREVVVTGAGCGYIFQSGSECG